MPLVVGNFALYLQREKFAFQNIFDLFSQLADAKNALFGKERGDHFGGGIFHNLLILERLPVRGAHLNIVK